LFITVIARNPIGELYPLPTLFLTVIPLTLVVTLAFIAGEAPTFKVGHVITAGETGELASLLTRLASRVAGLADDLIFTRVIDCEFTSFTLL